MQTYFTGNFKNSLFTDESWQKQEVMIFVPHADDEINLTGATLVNLCTHNIRTRLVYFTNSDDTGENSTRSREALAAAKTLGLEVNNVILLGYCNNYRGKTGGKHFYNLPDDYIQTSSTGRRETIGLPELPEFCYAETGLHRAYTKANLRQDITDVILKYKPTLIIAVDFDRHQDHRALSLIFEEAVSNILHRPGNTYTPEIYKGFAYNGSYLGHRDFYQNLNLAGELQAQKEFSNDQRFDTDWPPYLWQQRLRLPVPAYCLSRTMRSNLIYTALQKHFSQGIIHNAKRVINSDQVFWRRRTDSLSYQAQVTASSGNSTLLNDFKLADCQDVYAKPAVFTGTWIPDADDAEKTARLTFVKPVILASIVLHGNVDPNSMVENVQLTLSNGFTTVLGPLPPGAQEYIYNLPATVSVSWIELQLKKSSGPAAGLNEIELYSVSQVTSLFKFIKIMVDDTFAYDWWLRPGTTKVDLSLYTYGCCDNGTKIYAPNQAVHPVFVWEMSSVGSCVLHGTTLELGSNFEEATVKVSLASDPAIYDQIVIRLVNQLQLAHLKMVQVADQVSHRIEHIAKSNWTKLVRNK